MNIFWIEKSDTNQSLILLFAGWGMDQKPFENFCFPNRDFAVVWDYDDYSPNIDGLNEYKEICVFAWSFGVAVASRFLIDNPKLPITLRVAINGTVWPIDDMRGIPISIYEATRRTLSAESLVKFRRRMCGSRDAYRAFSLIAPQRSFESVASELNRMAEFVTEDEYLNVWDKAYVGDQDLIFTKDNQLRAWEKVPSLIILENTPHLPDIQDIIAVNAIDKQVIADNFMKSADSYDQNAFVQRKVVNRLSQLIPPRRYVSAVEIGCGTGLLTTLLRQDHDIEHLRLWDLTATMLDVEICDAEIAIRNLPDESIDLITSASAFQWFHSPFSFLKECYRVLRRDGILAFSSFAPGTYYEVEIATGVTIPYVASDVIKRFLSETFKEVLYFEESRDIMWFDSPIDVLRHMKLTGVNSLGSNASDRQQKALKLVRDYPQIDNQYPLTYRPVYFVIKKR